MGKSIGGPALDWVGKHPSYLGIRCHGPRDACGCTPPNRLSRCRACLEEGVPGAGSEFCVNHVTRTGKRPFRACCSGCIAEGAVPPRKIAAPPRPIPLECWMLMCAVTWARENLGSKPFEFKKKGDSQRKGYHLLNGPVLQAINTSQEVVCPDDVHLPEENMTLTSSQRGRCPSCAAIEPSPQFITEKFAAPPAPPGRRANWVLGTISFQPDLYQDIYIDRYLRPGHSALSTCACAWEYDTQALEDLLRAWRPQNGRKGRCIRYLAHYAWVDSTGTKFVREDDYPGWLRAHEIVERRRFARPQAWSVPVGQSGCVLRRGATRCP
jgi:hypothetical protein